MALVFEKSLKSIGYRKEGVLNHTAMIKTGKN